MLPLITGKIPDAGLNTASESGARSYAATRGNVEAAPVTPAEPATPGHGRRHNNRRKHRPGRPIDSTIGQNLDVEV